MNKNNASLNILILLSGEIIVAILVIVGYLVAHFGFGADFSYRVITGAALGVIVTVLNYVFLTLSVDKAISDFLDARGNNEMTDEEAEAFAKENSVTIQNAMKTSYIVRTVSMLATLVLAFILDWFAPLATVIPLLAFRPVLYGVEFINRKFGK